MDVFLNVPLRNYYVAVLKMANMTEAVNTRPSDFHSTLSCTDDFNPLSVCVCTCHRSVANSGGRKPYLQILPGTGQYPHGLHLQVQRKELQGFATIPVSGRFPINFHKLALYDLIIYGTDFT